MKLVAGLGAQAGLAPRSGRRRSRARPPGSVLASTYERIFRSWGAKVLARRIGRVDDRVRLEGRRRLADAHDDRAMVVHLELAAEKPLIKRLAQTLGSSSHFSSG